VRAVASPRRSRTRGRLQGRSVWLVGASSGIGAALAAELWERGATVAVSARRRGALEAVAEDRMVVAEVDVTDRWSVDRAATRVREEIGDIDIAVLNAGYWEQMDAGAWDREVFAQHVDVNLLGVSNTLGAVLPQMIERGRGHIVGIASVAGYRGLPGAEAYGATKAAQINLLEAMRGALARSGVAVTTVCPGFVRTDMTAVNDFPMPFMVEPQQAARSICDGLERGRMEIVFPLPMALLMKAARLLPVRLWAAAMTRAGKSRRGKEAS
jgi:short-subunit dehydrogenase